MSLRKEMAMMVDKVLKIIIYIIKNDECNDERSGAKRTLDYELDHYFRLYCLYSF